MPRPPSSEENVPLARGLSVRAGDGKVRARASERRARRRFLGALVLAAAVVVALLLVLISLGYLVLPSASPAPVNIVRTHYTILEGTSASGQYWFGLDGNFSDQLTYPDFDGYPANLTPGGTFGVPIVLWNNDTVNHTIYSVGVNAPFVLVRSDPALPIVVPTGVDDASFVFTVRVPNQPGASLGLDLTIDALGGPT